MGRTFAVPARSDLRIGVALAVLGSAVLALALPAPASADHGGRPHPPREVRVVSTGPSTVTIAWTRTTRRSVLSRDLRRVGVTQRTRYVFRDLECDRTYRLGVSALDRSGRRSRGAARNVHTGACDAPSASGRPTSLDPPAVVGVASAGRVLQATTGSWDGALPLAYAFGWERCGGTGADCAPLSGATEASHVLGEEDVGSTLRVRVTATNAEGSASALSTATAVVGGSAGVGACSRADATGCASVAGSRISLLNQRFSCRRPLVDIAAENPIGSGPGTLPLLVEVDFTTFVELSPAVVEFQDGCFGDGDDESIDVILDVDGDGRTRGGTVDAIKVRLSAHDIQITGRANCGPRGVGADGVDGTVDDLHQDGAQLQGGDTIEFIDFEWGDWDTGTATCQGAAGTFVPGMVNPGYPAIKMSCIRCKSVSCNHGLAIGSGSELALVEDSMWRTGNPADTLIPLATGATGICRFEGPPCVVEADWHNGFPPASNPTIIGNTCDRWPYGDGA
jgi:hypothetical protein